MAKERYLYEVQPLSSLRELIELAKNESGSNVAYKFKDANKEISDRSLLPSPSLPLKGTSYLSQPMRIR